MSASWLSILPEDPDFIPPSFSIPHMFKGEDIRYSCTGVAYEQA